LQIESADAVAGDPVEIVVAAGEGNANESNELLLAAEKVLAEAQQPLPVSAKSIDSYANGFAVRPQGEIALEVDVVLFPISGGITTEKKSDDSRHPVPVS
jgi:hypothetical protein